MDTRGIKTGYLRSSMARYKHYDLNQTKMIPLSYTDQNASELGLIGKEHFAVDGCKLPSNASKKWSGTHKELDENIQNKGMRRFTLRGQKKVSAQWKLFTMVHNIEGVAMR